MFLIKHKKIIVSLAAAAALSLGGLTAFAASMPSLTLTPAGYVDLAKVDVVPGTLKVVEGIAPNIESGAKATTAPGRALTDSTGAPVAAVSDNVSASDFLGDNFTVETLELQDLLPLIPGQNHTTAAK